MAIPSRLKLRFLAKNRQRSSSRRSKTIARPVPLPSSPIKLNTQLPLYAKLYDYQRPGVTFALEHSGSCLFYEQRIGKTFVTLATVEQLLQLPTFYGLLVVPKSNKETTWGKQLEENLPELEVHRSWENFKRSKSKQKLLLVHYEQLSYNIAKWGRWTFVCFDESQRLKARGSVSSRRARFLRNADRRLILSGTPIDSEAVQLWAQFRFAVPQLFGENWGEFVADWCQTYGWMNKKVKIADDKLEDFHEFIKPYCLRMTKTQLGHKPPKVTPVYFGLLGSQRRLYEKLERDMFAQLTTKQRVTTGLKITQIAKLQQITSGFVYDDDHEIHRVGRGKMRVLERLWRQLPRPIVVFCKFRPDIEAILEAATMHFEPNKIGVIRGGPKYAKTRDDTQRAFQARKLDLLVVQIRTGGVGLDLWQAQYGVVYSATHSHIDFEQACARLDMIGEDQVEIFLLVARNTVDVDIETALTSKGSVTEATLSRLQRGTTP